MASIPKFTSFKAKAKPAQPGNESHRVESLEELSASKVKSTGARRETHSSHSRRHSSDHGSSKPRQRSPGPNEPRDSKGSRRRDDDRNGDRRNHRDYYGGQERRTRIKADLRLDSRRRSLEVRPSFAPDEFQESDLFLVDRRGDSKNVEYGSLHRYSIPQYRRTGFGFLVGMPGNKIDRDGSTEKDTVLIDLKRKAERQPRMLTSKHGKTRDSGLRLIVPSEGPSEEHDSDFIHLDSPRKRKRDRSPPDLPGPNLVDYRSIEGKAKSAIEPLDEDLELVSDEDVKGSEDENLILRQQNSVLSHGTKSSPADLEAWLALAGHQAKLVRSELLPDVSSFTTSERKALADLRLSIFHEASKHIAKGGQSRERLLLAIIEEGCNLWDSTKLAYKWQEVLKEHPSSILLWTRYLSFVQDDHSSFRYEVCKDAFTQCLSLLHHAQVTSDGHNREQIGRTAVYVLLHFTTFIRDAGYDELAIATWQAILELHFFMPKPQAGLQDRLAALEEFWDSEAPRVGEENALGWAGTLSSEASATRTSPQNQKETKGSVRRLRDLANEEARLLEALSLPATTDDDSVTDPFKHVLFSDLCEGVMRLDMPRGYLLNAFLLFMGLPDIPLFSREQSWFLDPHLSGNHDNIQGTSGSTDKLRVRLETTLSLFGDGFQHFQAYARRKGNEDDDRSRFVDRVLALTSFKQHNGETDEKFGESIAEYHIALRLSLFPGEAGKLAKRLLKARPSSLRLYNAYALVESHLGNAEKAEAVWKTAMDMSGSLASTDDMVILWHSRFMASVRVNNYVGALKDLLAISNSGAVSEGRAQQLKAKRELESGFDRALLSEQRHNAALYIDLQAWLAYQTTDGDIAKAIATYRDHDLVLSKHGRMTAARELVHQYKAAMVTHHLDRQKQYKPSLLRQDADASLAHFPNNSILIALHQRLQSQERLRTMFEDQKRNCPSPAVTQWSHKLSDAITRNEAYGTTVNAIRAMFSKALLTVDSSVKHSPALWTMWFKWELARSEGQSRARNVFLDGLRHLPWYKPWIILGMQHLDGTDRELHQWYDVLIERGLRVRIEIE